MNQPLDPLRIKQAFGHFTSRELAEVIKVLRSMRQESLRTRPPPSESRSLLGDCWLVALLGWPFGRDFLLGAGQAAVGHLVVDA